MEDHPTTPRWHATDLLAALPLLVFELAILTRWGWFRDELYFMASTEHLAWGYVDHPPLSIAVLAAVRALAGPSLVAMRLVSALCGAATLVVLARLVRRLGGGAWAVALTAAATTCSVALFLFHYYSLNAIDLLLWPLILLATLRAMDRPGTLRWLVVGGLMGLALLDKLSAVWLCGALLVGLLATPARRHLRTRGPWLAAALALAIFAPNLAWQQAHDWPTLEFVANARAHKIEALSPLGFLGAQLQMVGPVSLALALLGAVAAVVRRRDEAGAVVGWVVLVVTAYLVLDPYAKPYYLLAPLTGGFALGATELAAAARRFGRRGRNAALGTVLALQIGFGVVMAPVAAPVLSPEGTVAYLQRLGMMPPSGERGDGGPLPQHLADMHGWQGLAEDVAAVYFALPDEERRRTAIYATNYGRAGAIDVLGRPLGLPPALSGHNSYWLWGRDHPPVDTLILVGGERDDYDGLFEELETAAVHTDPWARPGDARLEIFIGRGLRRPLAEVWPRAKDFI